MLADDRLLNGFFSFEAWCTESYSIINDMVVVHVLNVASVHDPTWDNSHLGSPIVSYNLINHSWCYVGWSMSFALTLAESDVQDTATI